MFTLNNYTEEEVEKLMTSLSFSFILFGKEEAPSTGTPHLQGYFELPKKKRQSAVSKIDGLQRAWTKKAEGTAKQSYVYCGKDIEPFQRGEAMNQGKRSDLISVKRKIDEGISNELLWEENFSTMIHNHRAIAVYKRIKIKKRSTMSIVFLFVGPTGTGKSELAHVLAESLGRAFTVPSTKGSGLYFDQYDGHDSMIIDEMDGNRCTPTFLNTICDKYPNSLPVHGSGNVENVSKYIFICSNYVPKQWWKTGHNIKPFMRRCTIIWFSGKPLQVLEPEIGPCYSNSGYFIQG